MDISSILPMLMQRQNGGQTDMSALVNALAGQQNSGQTDTTQAGLANLLAGGGGNDPAALLSMLKGGGMGGGGNDPAALLSMLKGGGMGGGSPNLNLVNLLSTLGKTSKNTKKLHGLKPVKSFIPDQILGKMVKFFQ